MAKRYSIDRAAVEAQCGYAKALASSIENHANNTPVMTEMEREFHRTTADQLWKLVHGLTEAVSVDDPSAVSRWWRFGLGIALGFSGSVGIGIGESVGNKLGDDLIPNAIEDETVTRCASLMLEHGRSASPLVSIAEGRANFNTTVNLSAARGEAQLSLTATGKGQASEPTPLSASLDASSGASAAGRRLERTINDIVGLDDSVVKGLAETATSAIDLDGTVKGLAETARQGSFGLGFPDSNAIAARAEPATAKGTSHDAVTEDVDLRAPHHSTPSDTLPGT